MAKQNGQAKWPSKMAKQNGQAQWLSAIARRNGSVQIALKSDEDFRRGDLIIDEISLRALDFGQIHPVMSLPRCNLAKLHNSKTVGKRPPASLNIA
jgi:hypothetical protein